MLSFLAPWESSESPHLSLVWESPIPFLTPTGSPGQQTGQFEPGVFLPRYCCWVFEFQVPCYEWVISSSISGELLWVQSPEAEWGWLRQRNTQSLMGPACGGLWDVEAGVRGVQGEHRGGLDVVMCSQRKFTAGSVALGRIWNICLWPQTQSGLAPQGDGLLWIPYDLLQPSSLCKLDWNVWV